MPRKSKLKPKTKAAKSAPKLGFQITKHIKMSPEEGKEQDSPNSCPKRRRNRRFSGDTAAAPPLCGGFQAAQRRAELLQKWRGGPCGSNGTGGDRFGGRTAEKPIGEDERAGGVREREERERF